MLELENQLLPGFDNPQNVLPSNYQILYINMMSFNNNYKYTDGQDLTVISGQHFSMDLAIQMDKLRKQPELR